MKQISNLIGVSVETANSISGALSTYTVSVVPNTPVSENDAFTIQFPSEVILPSSNSLDCGVGGVITNVLKLACIKSGTNQITATLLQVGVINAKN